MLLAHWRLFTACLAILIALVVGGCDSLGNPATPTPPTPPPTTTPQSVPSTPIAAITSTSAPATAIPANAFLALSPTENATESLQEFKAGFPPGWFSDPTNAAVATQIPIRRSQYLTAIALTPTLPPVPYTPAPTATFGVGMIQDTGCMPPLHDGKPQFPSCGEAYVNGTWLFVGAGYTGGGIGAYNPPPQSLLVVCPEPLDEHWGGSDAVSYETPVNVGEIRIESLAGSLVTVVPRDPNNHTSFVFDLATRQWVSSTSGSSPAPSVGNTRSPADYGLAFATAKAQFAINMEQTRVVQVTAAAALPTAPPVIYTPARAQSPYRKPTGIREPPNLGMHPCDCNFLNAWTGVQNGWYLDVYAGSWEWYPDQGLLMLDRQTIDLHQSTMDLFSTPTREGPVRIVSANGLQLTLQSTNGTKYIFDAGTQTWINPPVTPTIPTTGNASGNVPGNPAMLILAVSLLGLGLLLRRKSSITR